MEKKKDYFRIFCKVSQAFGTTLEREDLLNLIVESATDTMDGKAACLFLADKGKDVFVPVAQNGLSADYLHAKPMKAKTLVAAIMKGGFLSFRDATTDPRLENHEAKKAEGIASILTVPVRVRNTTIGILSLYTGETRDFSEEEIEFLSALADHGGLAIHNARLLDRIRNNSQLFLELASKINSSLDIKTVLHHLTVETCDSLGMKGASIYLLNSETDALERVTTHGLSETFLNQGPITSGEDVSKALNGETFAVSDVTREERPDYRKAMIDEGIGAMLCVPVKSREDVIGLLRLYAQHPREFPEDLVIMVNALAHTGALAIENASMYLKLQEDKTDLEKDIWSHRSWF